MDKNRTVDDVQKDIDRYTQQRNEVVQELQRIETIIMNLNNEYCDKSEEFVKILCLSCGGKGYIKQDDKKVVCNNEQLPFLSCNGKGYIWMRKA